MMQSSNSRGLGMSRPQIIALLLILVIVVVVISAAYVLILPTSHRVSCLPESFGINLGFEAGNLDGWTNPIGFWHVISNVTHSGKYAAWNEWSSKFSSELYQNWHVNLDCEIYLEAYVYITCGFQGFNMMGIELRETDAVELGASVCPNPGNYPLDQDAVIAGIRQNGTANGTWMKYPFVHNQWYKFGVTVQPGRIGYYVNDQLMHAENRTVTFSNPSFGARAEVWSATYFDDFAMGQRNPPSSSYLSAIPNTSALNDGNPFLVALCPDASRFFGRSHHFGDIRCSTLGHRK